MLYVCLLSFQLKVFLHLKSIVYYFIIYKEDSGPKKKTRGDIFSYILFEQTSLITKRKSLKIINDLPFIIYNLIFLSKMFGQ